MRFQPPRGSTPQPRRPPMPQPPLAPPTAPGTRALHHVWLTPKKALLISGKVHDVAKTAQRCQVAVEAKCWPPLLTRQTNKQACCPEPNKPGHRSPTDAAHVLPGFDLQAHYASDCVREPSAEERQRLEQRRANFRQPSGQ